MFGIGWSELLVIGALALIVVGPKELPGMLRQLGRFTTQARRMARDFQRTMEDAADAAEMGDVQKSMADWNRKIGAASPRKYAESLLKEDDAKQPAEPARGSFDEADAAENAAWESDRATKRAEAEAGPAAPEPDGRADETPRASRSA